MEGLGSMGSIIRLKNCVFDLLSLGEELIEFDDEFRWELFGRDLRLRSTFLYCELNNVISYYRDERKRNLTEIANKFFNFIEELDKAVKCRSLALAQICYRDAALTLQEVVASLIPVY